MFFLVLKAYAELIRFGRHVARHDFATLREQVRSSSTRIATHPSFSCDEVCHGMDIACTWYWRQVLCLQRSAATTCLLRRYGSKAEMVIASQRMPFQAHAWVEVEGKVVNDKPHVQDHYAVLDRC
jgi:hypothetical protein